MKFRVVIEPDEDGVFVAECPTLRQCEQELRSTLEDWLLLGFHLGHTLPVVAGIDLNKPAHAHMESVPAA